MTSRTSSLSNFRQSRFLEDEAVGGKAPTQREGGQDSDGDGLPVYTRVVRYLSFLNPLNALRARTTSDESSNQESSSTSCNCSTLDDSNPPRTPTSAITQMSRNEWNRHLAWTILENSPRRPSTTTGDLVDDEGTQARSKKLRCRSLMSLRKTPSTISLKAKDQIHNASQSLKRHFSTNTLKRHEKHNKKLENRISTLQEQLNEARSELRSRQSPASNAGASLKSTCTPVLRKSTSWSPDTQEKRPKKSPKWRSPRPPPRSFSYAPQSDAPHNPDAMPSHVQWLIARPPQRVPSGETYEEFWGMAPRKSPARKRKSFEEEVATVMLGQSPPKRRRVEPVAVADVVAGEKSSVREEKEDAARRKGLDVITEEEPAWGWPDDCF